jgi:glycine hydroxymethyltransferase
VLLVDLRKKKVTGATAETVLGEGNIVCNKNGIPFDSEKPTITSGIRLGTPAATTRGFKETQFKQVGSWILRILDNVNSERSSQVISKVKKEVIELCSEFPIY